MKNTTQIGAWAENIALNYLIQNGLRLIARNYKKAGGEIDLIMKEDQTLVFIEVRYKKNTDFGSHIESVNFHKQRRIIQAATYYLQWHSHEYENSRLDFIGVDNEKKITWIKNAFQVK